MSSSFGEPVGSQASETMALSPSKQKRQKPTNSQKPTPLQQRKKDALDMAELIYAIYNKNCPIVSKTSVRKENENA